MICNVGAEIERAQKILTRAESQVREALDAAGGRGVELANEIDRISLALSALNGGLSCRHCGAVLTSERP